VNTHKELIKEERLYMKTFMAAMLVMLLVVSSALGAGSFASQSNSQTGLGNGGVSSVDQDAANTGLMIGDNNIMTQSNGQFGDMEGMFSSITQDSANSVIIAGDGNTVTESNLANAWNFGLFADISQTQDNLGLIIGDENTMNQANGASATISTGISSISQVQSNMGMQLGDSNELDQSNNAYANLDNSWSYGADAYAGFMSLADASALFPYSSATGSNPSNKYLSGLMWNPYISQSQSNNGLQIGDGNVMVQTNDANADINVLYENMAYANAYAEAAADATGISLFSFANAYANADALAEAISNGNFGLASIDQVQSNNGLQLGDSNVMAQSNDADASIDSTVVAYANANADSSAYASALEVLILGAGPTADADAYANANADANANMGAITVTQDQTNLAAQIGTGNELEQSNIANADIDATVKAIAWADANADSSAFVEDRIFWAYPSANADADADAYATANANLEDQIIDQDQSNLALQIGAFNYMSQLNDANAVIDLTAISDLSSDADATAYANGYTQTRRPRVPTADAYANSLADADSTAYADVGSTSMTQTQSNNGLQFGFGNTMLQTNDADTSVFADYQTIWSDAESTSDSSSVAGTANADANANSNTFDDDYFAGDNVVTQNQRNLAAMLGSFDTVKQDNIAGDYPVELMTIDEDQTNIALVI
jgi:hypothetical protein